MKQTAVDWLVDQLNKQNFAQVVTDEEIKQAKQMEKEQIKEAFKSGSFYPGYELEAQQYYFETYGKDA